MTLSLQQISDRLEIEDLVYCYSQAIDQQAFDVLDTVFTADAFVDYSAMGGAKGSYPEVKAFLQGALPRAGRLLPYGGQYSPAAGWRSGHRSGHVF
jgi:hypothetical protein